MIGKLPATRVAERRLLRVLRASCAGAHGCATRFYAGASIKTIFKPYRWRPLSGPDLTNSGDVP